MTDDVVHADERNSPDAMGRGEGKMIEVEDTNLYPIRIRLEDGATQAILKPGNGHWQITDCVGTRLEMKQPLGGVNLRQTANEVLFEVLTADAAELLEVTVYFERESHTEDLLQAELCRSKNQTQGRVAVYSVEGEETEYLLEGDDFRHVTLPLSKPPHGGCHSDG